MTAIREGYAVMQNKNESMTPKPKPGDGTQETKPTQDANRYGPSEVPQEEFIDSGPSAEERPGKLSEGPEPEAKKPRDRDLESSRAESNDCE